MRWCGEKCAASSMLSAGASSCQTFALDTRARADSARGRHQPRARRRRRRTQAAGVPRFGRNDPRLGACRPVGGNRHRSRLEHRARTARLTGAVRLHPGGGDHRMARGTLRSSVWSFRIRGDSSSRERCSKKRYSVRAHWVPRTRRRCARRERRWQWWGSEGASANILAISRRRCNEDWRSPRRSRRGRNF